MKQCFKNMKIRAGRFVIQAGFLLCTLLLGSCITRSDQDAFINMESIERQVMVLEGNNQRAMSETFDHSPKPAAIVPRSIDKDGNLMLIPSNDWCSGFYPGILWYMFELTGGDHWKVKADSYTRMLEGEKMNRTTHDMGFKMMSSYGNGYRLTGDSTYREVLIQSAKSLITRFNETVGCIRSWDWNQHVWQFPVIIDNMMNLELLFWATEETGDSIYYKIAEAHALTTLKHQFREDYGSFHVVDYDSVTGEVIARYTHQGYADSSTWSRGEAWALYGYTMAYRFTGRVCFLDQAIGIASFILEHPNLPVDWVPYWDFIAPGIPDEPRDVSAATIMASALYELSRYADRSLGYSETADQILAVLGTRKYRAAPGTNKGFLLEHSVGHMPLDNGVDAPVIYADYYYLEALCRKGKLSE